MSKRLSSYSKSRAKSKNSQHSGVKWRTRTVSRQSREGFPRNWDTLGRKNGSRYQFPRATVDEFCGSKGPNQTIFMALMAASSTRDVRRAWVFSGIEVDWVCFAGKFEANMLVQRLHQVLKRTMTAHYGVDENQLQNKNWLLQQNFRRRRNMNCGLN